MGATAGRREPQRHRRARPDVVAAGDRAQEFGAASGVVLGQRKRRRHHRASRMKPTAQMRVVGLVRMRAHRRGEGGIGG
jgi:hypothetical protein